MVPRGGLAQYYADRERRREDRRKPNKRPRRDIPGGRQRISDGAGWSRVVEYPSKRELDKLALELAAAEAAEAADSDDETDLNPAAARRHISRANTFAGKLKDMKKIQAAYRSHLQQPTVYVQGSDIHQQMQPMELGASYGQLRDFLRQPS